MAKAERVFDNCNPLLDRKNMKDMKEIFRYLMLLMFLLS